METRIQTEENPEATTMENNVNASEPTDIGQNPEPTVGPLHQQSPDVQLDSGMYIPGHTDGPDFHQAHRFLPPGEYHHTGHTEGPAYYQRPRFPRPGEYYYTGHTEGPAYYQRPRFPPPGEYYYTGHTEGPAYYQRPRFQPPVERNDTGHTEGPAYHQRPRFQPSSDQYRYAGQSVEHHDFNRGAYYQPRSNVIDVLVEENKRITAELAETKRREHLYFTKLTAVNNSVWQSETQLKLLREHLEQTLAKEAGEENTDQMEEGCSDAHLEEVHEPKSEQSDANASQTEVAEVTTTTADQSEVHSRRMQEEIDEVRQQLLKAQKDLEEQAAKHKEEKEQLRKEYEELKAQLTVRDSKDNTSVTSAQPKEEEENVTPQQTVAEVTQSLQTEENESITETESDKPEPQETPQEEKKAKKKKKRCWLWRLFSKSG